MHYAVVKTGGKQYIVSKGTKLRIEKVIGKDSDSYVFPETLATFDAEGKEFDLGTPKAKAKVTGKILRQAKADKVSVIKFKNKVRYRRNRGHRQPFTEVEITSIA